MDKVILNCCANVDVIIAMAMMMNMMIEIAMMKLKNMLRFIDDPILERRSTVLLLLVLLLLLCHA